MLYEGDTVATEEQPVQSIHTNRIILGGSRRHVNSFAQHCHRVINTEKRDVSIFLLSHVV